MIRIFIGYDPRQAISYAVLCNSIIRHASVPVSITPLVIDSLPVPKDMVGLTPFTYTRYLVPWLANYWGNDEGLAIFMDADIVVRGDIKELLDSLDLNVDPNNPDDDTMWHDPAIWVCKSKPRFEWPSVMVFDCGHEANKILTPEYIAEHYNKGLTKLDWLAEDQIGDIPDEWNHCVFYDPPNPDAKLIHYTAGVPIFPEVAGCEHEDAWRQEHQWALNVIPWQQLMGTSVHVQKVQEHLLAQGKIHPPRPDAPAG